MNHLFLHKAFILGAFSYLLYVPIKIILSVPLLYCKNLSPVKLFSEFFIFATFAKVCQPILTHCGRVTQICVFNTVKLSTSASSP